MSQLKIWLMAIRPRTLGAAIAPVMIGSALAISQGVWDPLVIVAALLASLFIQIGTNLANDYFDFFKGADTEERIGPVRVTQAGLVKPAQVKWGFILSFALTVLPGLYLVSQGGWPITVVGICSVLSGILYTGGPFPLGYKGLGDLFVFLFFGLVAVCCTYYLHTHTLSLAAVLASIAPGLLSTAILVVNNLRDMETDRAVNKKTLAVRFGAQFVRYEYLLSIFIASLVPVMIYFLTPEKHIYSLAACLTLLVAIKPIRTVFELKADPRLNPLLGTTNQLLLLYGVLFSVGWLLG